MTEPSKRPWRACGDHRGGCSCAMIWSVPEDITVMSGEKGGAEVGFDYDPFVVKANVDLVVRAVNNFDRLLAACKAFIEQAEDTMRSHDSTVLAQARAAVLFAEAPVPVEPEKEFSWASMMDGSLLRPEARPTPPTYIFEVKGRRSFTRDGEERGGGRRDESRGVLVDPAKETP